VAKRCPWLAAARPAKTVIAELDLALVAVAVAVIAAVAAIAVAAWVR
jgi:hypothetical protein